jgi:hypothetical protein
VVQETMYDIPSDRLALEYQPFFMGVAEHEGYILNLQQFSLGK